MLYTIRLVGFRGDEIVLIDLCMRMCGMDMGQAASCLDNMPSVLMKNAEEELVNDFKREFESIGATLKITSSDEDAGMDPAEEKPKPARPKSSTQARTNTMQNSTGYNNDSAYGTQYDNNSYDYSNQGYSNADYSEQGYTEDNYSNDEYVDNNYANTNYDANSNYDTNYAYAANANYDANAYADNDYDANYDNTQYQNEQAEENYDDSSSSQSVVQINTNSEEFSNVNYDAAKKDEEAEMILVAGCPKCGSSFVSAKKVNGMFGGTKIKYVCDACKHKF